MLKVLSLFSGIGAFEKALERQGIEYQLVNYCEIDKYASKSYSLIHNVSEQMNLGDITKIDTLEMDDNVDFITYGFPCQDISLAGKQKGFEQNGELTRSGLFFEALRIIEDLQPKVAICENVKNLTSKKFSKEFGIVLQSLEEAGYNNYWQVLNAKDYGIPQNRERVFIVSIRKDIDTGYFEFPKPFELKLRLKDMLEDEVDEKYYLSDEYMKRFLNSNLKMNGDIKILGTTVGTGKGTNSRHWVHDINGIVGALSATDYKQPKQIITTADNVSEPKLNCIGNLSGGKWDTMYDCVKRVYDENGLCPTISTCQGGHTQPKIMSDLRIRKLTPRECFRLMGFDDSDFDKVEGNLSNTQLYKQAGNSIVVNVLEEIYKELFKVIKL